MEILMISVITLLISIVIAGNVGAQTNIGSNSGFNIDDTNRNLRLDADETGIPDWNIRFVGIGTGIDIKKNRKGAQTNIGSISGFKIDDTNRNGKWDAGEAGIQRWNITLKNTRTGAVIASNLTDANGFYQFMNLVNGSYNVTEEMRTGFNPTNATFNLVTIAGLNVVNLNFTNQPMKQSVGGIMNSGFENGTANWTFYTNGTGTFSIISPGYEGIKAAKVVLNTNGTNIQLYQKRVKLEPNTKYRLSFAAYSRSGHDLSVNLIKHGSPYTNYGLRYKANLGKSWQTFSTEFTTKGFTGTANDGRLMFWLAPFAKAGDRYYIDEVQLEKVAAATGAPSIISSAPSSHISDTTGTTRTFNVTIDKAANVTWYINGTQIQFDENVSNAIYTKTSADQGIWNISAVASNANGSDIQTWIWTVTAPVFEALSITSYSPVFPVNDTVGARRKFNIAFNQTANVTWYINGTPDQFNGSVTTANYTNISAAAGTWNVTATGSNSNGTASQIWTWIVNAYIPGTPTNLDNTTGTFWVNHTWSAGENTDSFNVSANGNWDNSSNAPFRNTASSAHGWVNISVAGYNSTSHLLSDFISQDTQILNNPISITDIQDSYSLNEGQTITIDANYTDEDSDIGTFARNFSQGTFDTSTGILSWTTGAGDAGVYNWQINVTDGYGSVSTMMFMVTVTTASASPPKITSFAPSSPVSNSQGESRLFNITANQTVNVIWYINGVEVFNQNDVTESSYTNTSSVSGTWNVNATVFNSNGTDSKEWIWTVTSSELPPDPITVAPPVDTTVATNIATATEFLYTGSNPIQTGVAPDTIEARRAAVLRGRVLNREGTPLSGVNISILSHPEFGSTMSRADGMFDMAVNGGGLLTVNYEKQGYLQAQRQVQTPWQDFAWLPDVVLIQADTKVTAIDLSSSASIQVAQGSVVNDSDGIRQATLLFPQSVQANMTLPDGTKQPLTTLHVRATEYTVGENGPEAMPAQLPPTSGYTYAVDLTIDEAMAAGASDVTFDKPVYTYVENFLNFPVGGIVPVGYYNRSLGQWIPSNNGLIIEILSITGGMADLDVNGSNKTANASQLAALNITDAERQQLAELYQPDQSLWRVPIVHFTPWDCNWPYGPPKDATPPNQPTPDQNNPPVDNPDEDPCGSVIGCQNQVLGEAVDISGTPFSLHYQSDRVQERIEGNTLKIPLSGGSVPASLKGINLEVFVAGRSFSYSFPAAPNQIKTFTWDGKDAYGRILQGRQPIDVRIGYVYQVVYLNPVQFGKAFGAFGSSLTGSRARQEAIIWQSWNSEIGIWDARGQGLGGWSLNVHHAYDTSGNVLRLGDGRKYSAQSSLINVITTVAGSGSGGYIGDNGPATQAQIYYLLGVTMGTDGSIYIADSGNNRIRRVGPDGIITTVAGDGSCNIYFGNCYRGDGGPATQAQLSNPTAVAIGADESIYIADNYNSRIRRVGTDGIITTVAGGGSEFIGDGGPATQAQLYNPMGVAIGGDGGVYIADSWNQRVRRVGTDGIITTVAGNGIAGFSSDGGPATQAQLSNPTAVAIGVDGSIYIADYGNNRIRRVGPDGIITTVAGNGNNGFSGDGGPATQAQLSNPFVVAMGADGSIYITDFGNNRIRHVGPDGIITTVAGNGNNGFSGDGGLATQAQLSHPIAVAIGADGSIYIADSWNHRVRRVAPALPGFSLTDFLIPSDDGSELYIFNSSGRHLRTLDALTGSLRYNFTYDNAGKLNAVTDSDGNMVTIERDAAGNATAILSPYGQRTDLSIGANGYLDNITNPAGESVQLSYTADGLLTSMTDSRGSTYNYSYDTLGRLIKDEDPAGGFKALERTDIANGYSVKLSTGLSRNTTYQVERLSTGDLRRGNTYPDGLKTETVIGTNGTETNTYPDGTRTTLLQGPDPRFGMQAPVTKSMTITSPGGLKGSIISDRTAVLTNPNNPLSLKTLIENASINGRMFTSTFDAASRNITSLTPMGRTSITTLDNKGRAVESQVPGIVPVHFTYDTRGRLSDIMQGTRTYALRYDTQGNLANITDPLSRTAGFEYDLAGRITKQTFPDGRQVQYTYDASGNVISITPPGRPNHTFNYTPIDLIKDYTPPDIGTGDTSTNYSYNIDRQLTKVTRPDGAAIDLGYDSTGRLSAVNYPQGTTGLSYDAATGNLKDITAPDGGKISYVYDGSLLTDTAWSGAISGSVHRTYDNNFSITSENVNGTNAVNFQYDQDGLLTQAGSLSLSRDPQNGMFTGSTLGNVTDTIGYSSFGEAAGYQAAYSGAGIFSVNYTRDVLGRIVQKNETIDGATHTYAYMYDQAGRLTNVSRDGVMVSQYVYDANGNRLSYTGAGGTISGTYDNQDRLMQYGAASYTYTANGELLSKTTGAQTTTYQYDVLGNLLNVTMPDGTKIEYMVDGLSRRIGKKVNGVLVQGFLYRDGLQPVAELDGSGNVVSRFVYAGGVNVPDYMVKGGTTYRIITDHLGSPRIVIDASTGTVVQRMDYDEFGNVTSNTNPGFQPFGFAGGLYDHDTKLVHFGARDYDAEIGRWTAKDPILFAGGQANLYGYVLNDPINLIDPMGLTDWRAIGRSTVGGAVAGAVGGAAIGAAGGTFVLPIVGTVGGALGVGIAGAITGALTGALSEAISQVYDDITAPIPPAPSPYTPDFIPWEPSSHLVPPRPSCP